MTTRTCVHRPAPRQGLYDPANEHDACGVGFVANVEGNRSHDVIRMGVEVLINLEHRGACGCDPETGDGAGLLIQLCDAFMRREATTLGFELPEPGRYAVGFVFLAQDPARAEQQARVVEEITQRQNDRFNTERAGPVGNRRAQKICPFVNCTEVSCELGGMLTR